MRTFPFTREVVERVIKDQGYDDVIKIYDRYVGRGMLPATREGCVGFVGPEVRNVVQLLLELAGETEAEGVELEDLVVMTGTMCSDNMGLRGAVVYFPSYTGFAEPKEEQAPEALPDDHWSKNLNPLPGLID